jgi:hypothetical protein
MLHTNSDWLFCQCHRNNYSYNTVHNGPHNCMLGGGNEGWPWGQGPETGYGTQCLFEGNTLDTCVFECGDCGAFYSCGQQGTAVRTHSTPILEPPPPPLECLLLTV